MKLNIIDENNIIIFLSKLYTKDSIKFDKENLEIYFKKIFKKLQNNFDIKINGYYNINVYVNKDYGIVMEIFKEELDYYNYFDDDIEMQIKIYENSKFLYSFDDIFEIKKGIGKIYKYNDKYYLELEKKLSKYEYAKILEFSSLIYNDINKITKTKYLLEYN